MHVLTVGVVLRWDRRFRIRVATGDLGFFFAPPTLSVAPWFRAPTLNFFPVFWPWRPRESFPLSFSISPLCRATFFPCLIFRLRSVGTVFSFFSGPVTVLSPGILYRVARGMLFRSPPPPLAFPTEMGFWFFIVCRVSSRTWFLFFLFS